MFDIRDIFMEDKKEYNEVEEFLNEFGLDVPKNIDYTIGVYHEDEMVAVGSLGEGIIKGVAVSEKYQGEGLLPKLITGLINKAIESGEDNLFIFTKSSMVEVFDKLGFEKISETKPDAALLEWGNGLKEFTNYLEENKVEGEDLGAVIINANPFTNGHRYLIEKALEEVEHLYVFVVEENKSEFPFDIRFKLVKEGLKDLDNITVIPTSRYAVSAATFPSYFTKEDKLAKVHANLDLGLFINYIAKVLDINIRFVGEEPYSQITNIYNEMMKKLLPKHNIEVREIERLKEGDEYISASKVREYIRKGEIEKIKNMVPKSTYDFINSEKGNSILEDITKGDKNGIE